MLLPAITPRAPLGFFTFNFQLSTVNLPILSRLLCSRSLTAAFRQKHMEVRGQRLGAKLPHHQCDLPPMVSGVVRHMLHQVRQAGLCCAKRKHLSQGFIRHAIHELGLFFFNFRPLSPHRSNVGKCVRMEQGVPLLRSCCTTQFRPNRINNLAGLCNTLYSNLPRRRR